MCIWILRNTCPDFQFLVERLKMLGIIMPTLTRRNDWANWMSTTFRGPLRELSQRANCHHMIWRKSAFREIYDLSFALATVKVARSQKLVTHLTSTFDEFAGAGVWTSMRKSARGLSTVGAPYFCRLFPPRNPSSFHREDPERCDPGRGGGRGAVVKPPSLPGCSP